MKSGITFSIIVSIVFCASAFGYDWSTNPGDGSPQNPYQLSEPNHLIALGNDVAISQGNGYSFILMNDIVFDPNNNPNHVFNKSVIPILKGSLNGRGFTIENLKISITTYNNQPVGLIGIYDNGRIENLSIRNAQITVGDNFQKVGILCGLNGRYIYNCRTSGTITCGSGSKRIGGICGSNGDMSFIGDITHCQSDIIITTLSDRSGISECGGICGYNQGTIAHCSSSGSITAFSLTDTGGVCGRQEYGNIISSSASVDVSAQHYLGTTGGFCGNNNFNGAIRHAYATGNVSCEKSIYRVGGFCGYNAQGTIDTCYSTGSVSCGPKDLNSISEEKSGGFCGYNGGAGEIANCYSTGNVVCGPTTPGMPKQRWVAGFCGTNSKLINNCYSTGTVQTDATSKAGFCYVNYDRFENCFWDTDTSGILTAVVGGNIAGVTGKTIAQMKDADTFLNVGWDFLDETANGQNEIWRMCVDGVDYPRLSWEFARNGDFACGDGVDLADLQTLAEQWLTAIDSMPTTFDHACDANGDEKINLNDFGVLAENWQ